MYAVWLAVVNEVFLPQSFCNRYGSLIPSWKSLYISGEMVSYYQHVTHIAGISLYGEKVNAYEVHWP